MKKKSGFFKIIGKILYYLIFISVNLPIAVGVFYKYIPFLSTFISNISNSFNLPPKTISLLMILSGLILLTLILVLYFLYKSSNDKKIAPLKIYTSKSFDNKQDDTEHLPPKKYVGEILKFASSKDSFYPNELGKPKEKYNAYCKCLYSYNYLRYPDYHVSLRKFGTSVTPYTLSEKGSRYLVENKIL